MHQIAVFLKKFLGSISPYPLTYSRFPTFNEHYRPFFVSKHPGEKASISRSMHCDMQKNIKIGTEILNISGFPCLSKKIIDLTRGWGVGGIYPPNFWGGITYQLPPPLVFKNIFSIFKRKVTNHDSKLSYAL